MTATPQVDFFVLSGSEERARFKLGCRLAEQAYLSGGRIFVCFDEPHALQRFDDLLWTFADRSFVPHEIYVDAGQWQETAVLLGCKDQPQSSFELLVNLSSAVPAAAGLAARVAELIDADEERRRAGRNRFRQYRERGIAPETRNLATEDSPLSSS